MEQFNAFLVLLDSNLSGSWWFPALLIGTGIFFTIYLGFPQFKYFNSALKIVSGKTKNSESDGETTGFQALTTAMSGAVGTGNIGGVALAIWTGGPAAIFWMWITAIFGMTTKYVEVTLGHKYRTTLNDGSISGKMSFNALSKIGCHVIVAIARSSISGDEEFPHPRFRLSPCQQAGSLNFIICWGIVRFNTHIF